MLASASAYIFVRTAKSLRYSFPGDTSSDQRAPSCSSITHYCCQFHPRSTSSCLRLMYQTPQRPGFLDARESYNLLLAYQSSTSSHHSSNSHSTPTPPIASPAISTERVPGKGETTDPEWHDLVDPSLRQILERSEVKRQGLWWELIKGEAEYVKDLRVICRVSNTQLS